MANDHEETGRRDRARAQPSTKPSPGVQRKLAGVISDSEALAGFSRVRVAMVLTDPRADDNPIVYVNSAFERTTGYARSAVIGRNCRFLQGEGTRKHEVDKIRTAIEDGRDVTVDLMNYRADGRPFMNRLTIAPITDNDGQVMYFLGIQKEVYGTDRDEAEADALLVNIRSRVREDLSMVLEGIGDVGDVRDAESFDALSRRLECLELVYASMKLADAQRVNNSAIDLGALISRVAAAIAHTEGQPGVRYVQNIEPLVVNLDAAVRVSILLSEILSNAFHHAFDRLEEGLVELRLTKLTSGGLRLVVTDDGVGMPGKMPFPDPDTIGGRLITTMAEGLEATVSPIRGAAGTVVMIDVPTSTTDV